MNTFNNKKVIVTGGASGIGLATTNLFSKKGADVIVIDKNQSALEKLDKNKLTATFCGDVSNYTELMNIFNTIDDLWNGIDILINNAGMSVRHPSFLDISVEDWKKVIETNLNSVFYLSKLSVPRMQAGGVILNMSSVNALAAFPHYADYNASKAGIIALTKTMAVELAHKKIRVNALCPGAVMTPMQQAEYTQEMFEEVNKNIPLKRHAEPIEIAHFLAFLASDEASFITGHYYLVDGGEMARAAL